MKTLILYATKYGAAREIAQRIAQKLSNATIHDLNQGDVPPLTQFDCVILGSSIYAGSVRKELKTFLSQYGSSLSSMKLGLFLCGLDASREKDYFSANYSAELIKAARATAFLGGIYDPQKTGAVDRFIMKVITKQSKYSNFIDDAKIEQFAKALKS